MKIERLTPAQDPYLAQYGLTEIDPSRLHLQRYARGEYLCHAGEPIPSLLLIIRGKVRVSITSAGGKSLLYCINVDKGIMGSIELLTGAPATASGLALTEVVCIAVPSKANLDLLRGSLAFMNCLCKELSIVFETSSRSSAQNILYPLETRLCSYIAMTQEGGFFHEKLTDLADLLGTSYRHLLRTLDGLCTKGILHKETKGYAVTGADVLQQIAAGYYER